MLSKKVERFKSGIYKITNITNGKFYIGSSVNIYNRKHTHITHLNKNIHHNQHLQNSYNKYGKDEFLFEVVEYCNKEKLFKREQYFINNLKPQFNKKAAEEHLNRGKKRPQEVVDKVSKSLKKRYKEGLKAYNQKHKWKTVQQYSLKGELIKEFEYPKQAELELNIGIGNIHRTCNRLNPICSGFQWKYKEDNKKINDMSGVDRLGKRIFFEDIINGKLKVFYSVRQLCQYYGFPKSSIKKVLTRPNKLYKNKLSNKTYKIWYDK